MMRLIIEYEDILLYAYLFTYHTVYHCHVAFNVFNGFYRYLFKIPLLVPFFADDGNHTRCNLSVQFLRSKITPAARNCGLSADGNGLFYPNRNASLADLCTDASGLNALRFKYMPIHDEHTSFCEVCHKVLRNKVSCPVKTCVSLKRVKFLKTVANSDVGADNENH